MWQQGPPPQAYPGQGQPPPPGFQPNFGYPQQPYPPAGVGYPPQAPGPQYPPPSYAAQPPPSAYIHQGGMYQSNLGDGEMGGNAGMFSFDERSIRHAFIRKVYSILMVQLIVTLGFVSWFTYHGPTRAFVHKNIWVFFVALAITFVVMLVLACCGEVRRKSPMNFICLSIFTLAESFLLGAVSSTYAANEVVMAVGITAVVCLALTIFAFQTKWDFTVCGAGLFVALIVLICFGFLAMFIRSDILRLIYASFGALLFSLYLIYDTQMMLGGKHKFSISPEEYIFAALTLYMDIVNIFMYILTIIGASRD